MRVGILLLFHLVSELFDSLLEKCFGLIPLDPGVKMVKTDLFFMMVKKENESAAETVAEPEDTNTIQNSGIFITYVIIQMRNQSQTTHNMP